MRKYMIFLGASLAFYAYALAFHTGADSARGAVSTVQQAQAQRAAILASIGE